MLKRVGCGVFGNGDFDPRFEQDVAGRPSPDDLLDALTTRGAGATCRVVEGLEVDYPFGAVVPLREALEWALGEADGWHLNLLCLPGRLAYWQDFNFSHNRVIVHRPT
jgi:hypothetical protein